MIHRTRYNLTMAAISINFFLIPAILVEVARFTGISNGPWIGPVALVLWLYVASQISIRVRTEKKAQGRGGIQD